MLLDESKSLLRLEKASANELALRRASDKRVQGEAGATVDALPNSPLLRMCKICPGDENVEYYSGLPEKRSHASSSWHKTNVQRLYRNLAPLPFDRFADDAALRESVEDAHDDIRKDANTKGKCASTDKGPVPGSQFIIIRNMLSSPDISGKNALSLEGLSSFPSSFSVHRQIFSPKKHPDINIGDVFDMASTINKKYWAFIICRSGEYAIGIVHFVSDTTKEWLLTKIGSSYTTRKRQGGSQLLRDKQGKVGFSAGSHMRRTNEISLLRDIRTFIKENKDLFDKCSLIFTSISPHLKEWIWAEETPLDRKDYRMRKIPFLNYQNSCSAREAMYQSLERLVTLIPQSKAEKTITTGGKMS